MKYVGTLSAAPMRKICKASLVRLAATPSKIKTMPRATKPSITDFRIEFFVGILSKKRSKKKLRPQLIKDKDAKRVATYPSLHLS